MKRIKYGLLRQSLLCAGMVFALGGCVPSSPNAGGGNGVQNAGAQSAGGEKVFVMGSEQFPKTIDPANEWDGWFTVRYGIAETLFRLDENMNPAAWLASGYERVDDTTWRIMLKPDIVFSNGTKVTPQHVVDNLKRLSSMNKRAAFLENAEYRIDKTDLVVKTAEPYTTFIHELCDPYTAIIDTGHLENVNTAPIGTGPYVSAEYVDDREIILRPNPNYHDGQPKLDRVEIKKILDKETGAIALKSGELDAFVELNPQSYEEFKNNPDFAAMSIPTSRVYSAYYNRDTLDSVLLREAIHLSIDKAAIGEYVLKKSVEPSQSPFIPGTQYGTDKLNTQGFDMEKAREKLKEANITDSDGNGFVEIHGEERELEIAYYPRLSNEQIATQIQASLTALGIRSKIVKYENSEYLKEGKFDIGLYTLVTTPIGDPQQYLENVLKPDGVNNYTHIDVDAVNLLLADLNKETDGNKRAGTALELSQMIYDNHWIEYIGFNRLNLVTTNKISGFTLHPSDYYQISVQLDKQVD